ncbi:RNA polymerase factor sigma-54 [Pelagibius sp. Alg239-R121]|uniref:RNA polymerase factor sigma-54 n=1 Tax=Pelagibius sp. Alg239-R121 TaxID=2993448 RepID=UPI0024A63361|nr:RNA polymerase factor sigma-54 [Pelagibius sp. Alg239-R121]
MAVTQRLELRQGQTLVMTPQLQQAIKLLQLSNVELAAFIDRELEQNPLLEREDGPDGGASENAAQESAAASEPAYSNGHDGDASGNAATGPETTSDPQAEPVESQPDSLDLANADNLPGANEAPLDTDFEDVYQSSPGDDRGQEDTAFSNWGAGGNTRFEDSENSIESQLTETVTLRQHLLDQLQIEVDDPVDRMIGVHLIDMLDASGYIVGELEELAATLSCDLSRVESTLAILQKMDPAGVFARSLSECLALQLAEQNRLDPAIELALDNLHLIATRQLSELRKICGVDDEDLMEMIAEIKALNPRPAAAFDDNAAEPIIPDVLMRAQPDGTWIVELNSDTLPRVLINTRYFAHVSEKVRTKEERDYLSNQYQTANWLVKSLHQRATTILKVAAEIVRQQDAFFRKGVQHMKPLTLRHIAEVIEMHESTVSRVTSNKYIVTPRGTYELKYFFTASIGGSDGESHSAEAVRHRIKILIDAENAAKVLSDDSIVEMLRSDGIDIARRTVAKYREAMRIPSSVQRRREKAAHL